MTARSDHQTRPRGGFFVSGLLTKTHVAVDTTRYRAPQRYTAGGIFGGIREIETTNISAIAGIYNELRFLLADHIAYQRLAPDAKNPPEMLLCGFPIVRTPKGFPVGHEEWRDPHVWSAERPVAWPSPRSY